MKKICLLLLLFPIIAFSKEDTLKVKDNRFFIGLSCSPDFCYRTNLNHTDDKQYLPKLGSSYYFSLKFRIHKNISFKTGFVLHYMGYQTKRIDSIAIYNPTFNGVNYSYVLNGKYLYSSTYCGIPVLIDYRIKTKNNKLYFNVSCGVEISWLPKDGYTIVNNQNKTMYSYYSIVGNVYPLPGSSKITYKPFPFFIGVINAGLNYRLNNNLVLTIEPTYRNVSSSQPQVLVYALYSIGINTGINFTF